MSQQVDQPLKTFTAGEALAAFRRVKLSSASGTQVEYADQADSDGFVGVTAHAAANGNPVTVRLWGANGTNICEAADAITVGAALYAANDGKVSDTSSGNIIGTALEVASGAGSLIEVLPIVSSASGINVSNIQNEDDGLSIPALIRAEVTAAGAEDEVVFTALGRRVEIVDAWMISRGTDVANVTLKNGSSAITGATAKSATDNTRVQFTVFDDANSTIAADGTLNATFSAAGSVEIFLLCVPVAAE